MNSTPGYWSQPRPELIPFITQRRARVLEVGCAEGRFLATLPGVEETWVIEPTQAAEVAQSRLQHVFQGTFQECEANLPLRHFDVIICNDVIEHMTDHDDFLARIGAYLAPGGAIIGAIPNVCFYDNMFDYLFEKDWHYTDAGILDRTHLRFFTETSLRDSLIRHGFTIEELSGINKDYLVARTSRGYRRLTLAKLLAAVTFGWFDDIRYLQFGFRAIKP